jgi:hypothetical protein
MHYKKRVYCFPVPSRDLTYQTLPWREKLNYSRPGRVWLVTSRLGTGKPLAFFTVVVVTISIGNGSLFLCSVKLNGVYDRVFR